MSRGMVMESVFRVDQWGYTSRGVPRTWGSAEREGYTYLCIWCVEEQMSVSRRYEKMMQDYGVYRKVSRMILVEDNPVCQGSISVSFKFNCNQWIPLSVRGIVVFY
jgi:hypothetical protein